MTLHEVSDEVSFKERGRQYLGQNSKLKRLITIKTKLSIKDTISIGLLKSEEKKQD